MIIHISLVTYIYTLVKGLDVGLAYRNPLPRQYCNVGWKMIGSIIYATGVREREIEREGWGLLILPLLAGEKTTNEHLCLKPKR